MTAEALSEVLDRLLVRAADDRDAALRRRRDGVHDLRVDLKRLRAFARLAERLNPAYDARREFAPWRRLFKAAAGWRDVHVLQDSAAAGLSLHGPGLSPWINELKRREGLEWRAFIRAARRRGSFPTAALKRTMAAAWSGVPPGLLAFRAAEAISLDQRRLAGRTLSRAPAPPDLHRIRIEAKELRYMIGFVGEASGEPTARADLDRRLRAVHQALGRWHDAAASRAAFEAFLAAGRSGVAAPVRRAFLSDLSSISASALAEFEAAWKRLFPPSAPAP